MILLSKERRDSEMKKLKARIAEQKHWHSWFAWYPITINCGPRDGEIVWLEIVQRKNDWPRWWYKK